MRRHLARLSSTLANFTIALLLDMRSFLRVGRIHRVHAKTGVGSFVAFIDLALETGWCEPRQKWPKSSLNLDFGHFYNCAALGYLEYC